MGKKLIVVDQNGQGDYFYIQDAIDAVSPDNLGVMIVVKEGCYYEKLIINKPNVTLVGEPEKMVSIVFDDHKAGDSGQSTATVWVAAPDFSAENLIFINSAMHEPDVSQATALYINGDRAQFHHCGFLGGEDVVVMAPLPLQVVDKDLGDMPLTLSRLYFKCCYFEGAMNILLNSTTALFEYCKIQRLPLGKTETIPNSNFGYVFKKCLFTGVIDEESPVDPEQMVFIECFLGNQLLDMADVRPTFGDIFSDASWCIGTPEYKAKISSRAS